MYIIYISTEITINALIIKLKYLIKITILDGKSIKNKNEV